MIAVLVGEVGEVKTMQTNEILAQLTEGTSTESPIGSEPANKPGSNPKEKC